MNFGSFCSMLERNEIITTPLTFGQESFETFPSFSADGKTIYYTTSKNYTDPSDFEKLRYDLCRVSFDPETGKIGTHVDTIMKVSNINKANNWIFGILVSMYYLEMVIFVNAAKAKAKIIACS